MKTIVQLCFFSLFFLTVSVHAFGQNNIVFPEPCSIKGAKYGLDSTLGVKNLSLYRENFKQWKNAGYKGDAINYTIEPWRFTFINAPLASQNTYFDGLKIYEYLMDQTSDSVLKNKYVDTLMLIYDQNIGAFGCSKPYGEGYVLGRKGVDLFRYRPDESELMYYTLEKSLTLQGSNSEAGVLSVFFKVTEDMVLDGKIDTALIYENYDKVMAVVDAQMAALKKEMVEKPADSAKIRKKMEAYATSETSINSVFEKWATCDMILKIYAEKFEANKTNGPWLTKLTSLMERKGCDDAQLYFDAAEALYNVSKDPVSALTLGKSYLKAKKFADAARILNEAVGGLEDPLQKSDAYLNLADAYRNLNQYANARTAAITASQLNPSDGMPFILIGDLYMITASSCGDNPVTQRAGYWAAADKYAKAKSLFTEESKIAVANAKYNAAYGGFPKTEDLFFYNISKGSSYTISCWYTESTIVRSID